MCAGQCIIKINTIGKDEEVSTEEKQVLMLDEKILYPGDIYTLLHKHGM